jgi:hypothetical protein
MDSTDKRISKLRDYSRICLSTLGNAGLSLALLKPLVEDRELRNKHVEAGVYIAHQHLANILLGSFLTEAISITEGRQTTQASLYKIRSAIESHDVTRKLRAYWRDAYLTSWDDSDVVLNEINLKVLQEKDVEAGLEHCRELVKTLKDDYDDLIASNLYLKSKKARDKILAHKDTWKCPESGAWRSEWFDRIGLNYSDAGSLYERLGAMSRSCHMLLTRSNYILGHLDKQAEGIAMRFWYNGLGRLSH